MRFLTLASTGVILFASTAAAQVGTGFTISDGDVFFSQPNSPTSGTVTSVSGGNFRLNGAAGTDHLFENWWWYRVNGVDTREFAFNSASGTVVAGNTATTTWPALGGGLFRAALTYTAQDLGVNAGYVTETLVLTSTASTPLSLNLFNYTDYDVNATSGTDNAIGGIPVISVTDGPWTINFEGLGATNYQVTGFSTLRSLLTNTAVNDLNNTGLPFGPGDFTGAFQWVVTLQPGDSITLVERLGIPAPGALALVGLGGLVAARRRRA